MLVIVLTFVLVCLHIDALLLLGFDNDRVVELGGGCGSAFTIDGRIVRILVIHAAVILIVERLAQIDLQRLQPAVHHLRALRHDTLNVDISCIGGCVSEIESLAGLVSHGDRVGRGECLSLVLAERAHLGAALDVVVVQDLRILNVDRH